MSEEYGATSLPVHVTIIPLIGYVLCMMFIMLTPTGGTVAKVAGAILATAIFIVAVSKRVNYHLSDETRK